MVRAAIFAVLFWSCARAEEPKVANSPARFSIEWMTNSAKGGSVAVKGNLGEALTGRSPQELFVVQVEQTDLRSVIGLPAISGKYEVQREAIVFHPQFPFQAGVKYRATFYSKGEKPVSSVLEIPLARRESSTVVREIFPTAKVLPENLLKFYLYFSAPMSGGHIYEHIQLLDELGSPVELPFLEIDEELWNSDMTRLTLFLDPGRIKRGVKPLEEVGPALMEGKSYVLTVDRSWLDANGTPLKAGFRKEFRVGGVDREPPDLNQWRIIPPKSGTKEPLKVLFPDPMDHALAARLISVESVAGTVMLQAEEREWNFRPEEPWKPGQFHLRVQTTIEDLAGNNIGKPFEVDLFEGVDKRIKREVLRKTFEVN
jgi:hypothetical protein